VRPHCFLTLRFFVHPPPPPPPSPHHPPTHTQKHHTGVLSRNTLSVNLVDEILTYDVRAGSAVIIDCAPVLVGNYYYLTILYCPPTLCCIVVIQKGCAPLADREAFYNQVFHQHRATVGYLVSFLNPSDLETWVCDIIILLSSYQHHNRQIACLLPTSSIFSGAEPVRPPAGWYGWVPVNIVRIHNVSKPIEL
jgi:hypothetical protein